MAALAAEDDMMMVMVVESWWVVGVWRLKRAEFKG
jgi:hypothetical protein